MRLGRKRIFHGVRAESKDIPSLHGLVRVVLRRGSTIGLRRCWSGCWWNRWWATVRSVRRWTGVRWRNSWCRLLWRWWSALVISWGSHGRDKSSGSGGCVGRRSSIRCGLTVGRRSTVVAWHAGNRWRFLWWRSTVQIQQIASALRNRSRMRCGVSATIVSRCQVGTTFMDGCFNGSSKVCLFLVSTGGDFSAQTGASHAHRANRISVSTWDLVGDAASANSKLKDLGHGKKGLAIDQQIILTKPRCRLKRRSCMAKNLDDMVPLGRPTKVQDTGTVGRVMNFSTVHRNLSFSRRDTPNNRHIMFFSTTVCSRQSIIESLLVWESESPVVFDTRKGANLSEKRSNDFTTKRSFLKFKLQ